MRVTHSRFLLQYFLITVRVPYALPPFPYVPILYGCPRFESSKVYLRTKCFTSYLTEYCSNLAQQNPCEIQIDRMQVLPDPIFLPPSPTRLMK